MEFKWLHRVFCRGSMNTLECVWNLQSLPDLYGVATKWCWLFTKFHGCQLMEMGFSLRDVDVHWLLWGVQDGIVH